MLDRKLERLVSKAQRQAEAELDEALKEIGEVALAMAKGDYGYDEVVGEIEEAIDCAQQAADTLDAVGCLNDRVFKAHNAQIVGLSVPRDHEAANERIRDFFYEKKLPRRGFAYVAWRARPEAFLYVGKARGSGRLNLNSHGKLASAIHQGATRVSLVFPARSAGASLGDLEASLLRLVSACTGRLPKLNSRKETVPIHEEGTAQLVTLAKELRRLADTLDPTR